MIAWGFEPEEFGIEEEAAASGEDESNAESQKDSGIQCFTCPACEHQFTVVREGKR